MKDIYKRKNTSIFMINYHFVFCPKYRRKIFDNPKIEARFKELISLKCDSLGIEIIAMECDRDHTHIFLSATPDLSPHDIVKYLKGATGRVLRREFEELHKTQNLWTRSYFISTAGEVSSETIRKYVEEQKKNGYSG